MQKFYSRTLSYTLRLSTITLTVSLAWFAFVFYPKVVSNYQAQVAQSQPRIPVVQADSARFPIETSAYRIVFENGSQTYYVFAGGKSYEEYVINRSSAKLTLKNALSAQNLCQYKIIYAPGEDLKLHPSLRSDTNFCS